VVRTLAGRMGRLPVERVVVLAIGTFLALVCSVGAVLQLGQSAVVSALGAHAVGVVRSCVHQDARSPVCTVEVTSPAAHAGLRQVEMTGLFDGLEPGHGTALWLAADGSADVAGWRGWADGLSLALVALVLDMVVVRGWRPILRPPASPGTHPGRPTGRRSGA
jgi:hypothetical protein